MNTKTKKKVNDKFEIGGVSIAPGERKKINLDIAQLYDFTDMTIPVEVIRSKEPGPILFISAAIHGDELNGVEIVRRLLKYREMKKLKGTLIAVPIVNVFGYVNRSRYMPDRRDLNRCFPGSKEGSLGGRLAYTFLNEIVRKCTHGIDLHTGSLYRTNLPQIRTMFNNDATRELAEAFGVPVILKTDQVEGSLREAIAGEIPVILFEGGESLRFEENIIQSGFQGILNVMHKIGMLPENRKLPRNKKVYIAESSYWERATHSGTFRSLKRLGSHVKQDEIIAVISDPFGDNEHKIMARHTGIIVGQTLLPLVNEGDAMYHIATFEDVGEVKTTLDEYDRAIATFYNNEE